VTYSDGTPATVDQMAKDVAAFLIWTAEPKLDKRKQTGWAVLGFLLAATVLAYLSKQVWSNVGTDRPPIARHEKATGNGGLFRWRTAAATPWCAAPIAEIPATSPRKFPDDARRSQDACPVVPDFPPGILFRDITTLIAHGEGLPPRRSPGRPRARTRRD
jgi:hypothetical protein